jgi:hemerythrin-like domain-containing protein
MMSTIESLCRQHQEVLAQLDAVEAELNAPGSGANLKAFAGYLEAEVMHHFAVEEQALFPVLARHLSQTQGPLAVMNAEHTSFRELVNDLDAGVRSGDYGRQRSAAQDLIELLRGHIAKEDQVLFPMASRLLSPDEQGEVESRAAALATSEAQKNA